MPLPQPMEESRQQLMQQSDGRRTVWRGALNTLVTALEEVLLDENGNPVVPTLPATLRPARGKQPACFGFLRSVPSVPPVPSVGDSPSKRKRDSAIRCREQKSQKLSNSLSTRFARSLRVSDDEDLDLCGSSYRSGTEDSEDVSDGIVQNEGGDVGQVYGTHLIDGHVASSRLRLCDRNDAAIPASPSLSTASYPASSASGSSGSGSLTSSGSSALPDVGSTPWMKPVRKFSKVPNGRIARRTGSMRSSAGWHSSRASSEPDSPSASSRFSILSVNYRHLQPKAKELLSMPACLRLLCLRRGTVPEMTQPRRTASPDTHGVELKCKAEFDQLVSQLLNRSGDSFDVMRKLVDQIVKWAQVASLSNRDLPDIYPEWNNVERNIETIVQYVQVYETMLETLNSGSPSTAATSLHDHVVALHGLLMERAAVFGDLLRDDGLAWKVLGFPVAEGLLEELRRWLVAVVAEALEMVWQVVQAFRPMDDGQTAKTILVCIKMASDISERTGKRYARIALLCTDLATVYVNWCIFEFDRRFRGQLSADGASVKTKNIRKGRVVVETKVMALFDGVIKILSQLKVIRDGNDLVRINVPGTAAALARHIHHSNNNPQRHHHHHHLHHHHRLPNRRQVRPLHQQDVTFGLAPVSPLPALVTPESAVALFPLPGDSVEFMSIEFPVETEQSTQKLSEVVQAEDSLAGAVVEAGLRLCEQAASAKLWWANGSGTGGVGGGVGVGGWHHLPAPPRDRARGLSGFVVIFLEFVVRFARKVLEYGEMDGDQEGCMTRIYGSLESLESAVTP